VEANVALDQAANIANCGRGLRLVVVWAVRFTRESLAEIIERDPLVLNVRQCASLTEAVAADAESRADIVLLDGRIPGATATVRRALEIAPGLRIIACSVKETEDEIVAWAEAGVIGYIPRNAALADFVRMVIDIHNGEQNSSGRVVTGLLRRIALTARSRSPNGIDAPLRTLTKRERQVAELIASGLSDKEIARQLNIGLATTKSHVHNLFAKLSLQRRSQVGDSLRSYSLSQSQN
jgi:two-component system, NarL family, nitrate/nitrite response regulator NarL